MPPFDTAAHVPAFEVERFTYRYPGGVEALSRLSFRIDCGETVALLGANGCGKSTLIKVLAGLIFGTEGTVRAFGTPLVETMEAVADQEVRRHVAVVFQNADAQLFCSTVRDELTFGPLHMGCSAQTALARALDCAELLGIATLLDRAPYQLSGGEKKKVALAAALSTSPAALLLDEPAAALDPRSHDEVVDLLVRLAAAGKTIITSTHDLESAPLVAARAIVLNEAHSIEADGPTADILADRQLLRDCNVISNRPAVRRA